MGMRFRKSKKIGGLRINLSKGGIGFSVGTKGARYTKKANGGTRSTLSIPGTGISYVKDSSKKKHNNSGVKATQGSDCRTHTPYFAFSLVLKVAGIIMITLSALITLALPPVGIVGIAIGILELFGSKSLKKKGIQQAIEEAEPEEENLLKQFNFTQKELELFEFLVNKNNKDIFQIHDISVQGFVTTKTYYENLFNKGLLIKPKKGYYSLNVELLKEIFKNKSDDDKSQ